MAGIILVRITNGGKLPISAVDDSPFDANFRLPEHFEPVLAANGSGDHSIGTRLLSISCCLLIAYHQY